MAHMSSGGLPKTGSPSRVYGLFKGQDTQFLGLRISKNKLGAVFLSWVYRGPRLSRVYTGDVRICDA